MKDKGIRHLNSYGRGDQLVQVNVFIPKKISSKEKSILKELSKSENFHPKNKGGRDKNFFDSIFG
jgi:molecular chaperone DnaJ